MSTQVELSKIEINEQVVFLCNANVLFVGIIVQKTAVAVKIDYCFNSLHSSPLIQSYQYSTWLPKSVLIRNKLKCLTVKKWFIKKFYRLSSRIQKNKTL